MKSRKDKFSAPSLLKLNANVCRFTVQKGAAMRCEKCKGLMVRERFSDYFLIVYAWKCINCGAIVDSTITHNQKKHPAVSSAESLSA